MASLSEHAARILEGMPRAWIGLSLLGLTTACFNPDDAPAAAETDTDAIASTTGEGESTDASGEGSTTDPSVGESESGSSTDTVDPSGADTDGTTTGVTTEGDDESSGGDESSTGEDPIDPACEDGVVVATEVCFETGLALEGDNYRFGFLEDLDGDGERDLIYSETSGEISVQLNSGGVFGLATMSTFNGVTSLSDLGFLHIDDDEVLDAFMVSISGAVVYTSFGATSGDFTLGDGESSEVFAFTMGDMTGDDREEAIAMSLDGIEIFGVAEDGTISVLENIEPANFGDYEAVRVADFNGDEQNDVIFVGQNFMEGPQVQMYLGNGNGTLSGAPLTGFVDVDDPTDLVVGDFDGDDAMDFVIADGSTLLRIYGNDALGFTQADDITVDSGTVSVLATADIDLDGIDDLLVGYSDRNVVTVYLGTGTGDFANPQDVSIGHSVERISTGDANGDDVPDIVVTSNAADSLTLLFSSN